MRKSFWMIPLVLLFTGLGSTPAHADTIVTDSSGNVIGIDGITVAGTTYNVTWGKTIDTTFAGSLANATAMNIAITNDLNTVANSPVADASFIGLTDLFVDGGTLSPDSRQSIFPTQWNAAVVNTTAVIIPAIAPGGVLAWDEFTVVSTPEPGTAPLTLAGLGVIAVLMWKRRQDALRHLQAT